MRPPALALVLEKRVGAELGPTALAVALVLCAEGGQAARTDAEFAELLGCSVRSFQMARTALVAASVLTYNPGQRNRPTSYEVAGFLGVAAVPPMLPPPPAAAPAEGERPVAVVGGGRKPQPTDDLFEVICAFAGDGVRHSAGGRVAKLAHQMLKAGLTAERLAAELPAVRDRYAGWRKVFDLDTITVCWPWILSPPRVAPDRPKGGSAFERVANSHANGDPWSLPEESDRAKKSAG
jgi:hypothetical protein